jgi:hypothetical protein
MGDTLMIYLILKISSDLVIAYVLMISSFISYIEDKTTENRNDITIPVESITFLN